MVSKENNYKESQETDKIKGYSPVPIRAGSLNSFPDFTLLDIRVGGLKSSPSALAEAFFVRGKSSAHSSPGKVLGAFQSGEGP